MSVATIIYPSSKHAPPPVLRDAKGVDVDGGVEAEEPRGEGLHKSPLNAVQMPMTGQHRALSVKYLPSIILAASRFEAIV